MPDEAEHDLYLAIIEAKTVISGKAGARMTELESAAWNVCEMNSPKSEQHVSAERAAQIVHHSLTLNTVFYICASESQILYKVLSSCSVQLQKLLTASIHRASLQHYPLLIRLGWKHRYSLVTRRLTKKYILTFHFGSFWTQKQLIRVPLYLAKYIEISRNAEDVLSHPIRGEKLAT